MVAATLRRLDGLLPLGGEPRGLKRMPMIHEDGWKSGLDCMRKTNRILGGSWLWVPEYHDVPNKYYRALQAANTAKAMDHASLFRDPRKHFAYLHGARPKSADQLVPEARTAIIGAMSDDHDENHRVVRQLVRDAWDEASRAKLPFVLADWLPLSTTWDTLTGISPSISAMVPGIITAGVCSSKPRTQTFDDARPPPYSASFTAGGTTVFASADGAAGKIDGEGRLKVAVAPTKFELPEWVGAVGFKAATSPSGRVIVVMLIPKESRTNIEPAAPHNKFRTQRAYTVAILPVHRGKIVDHLLPEAAAMHDSRFKYVPEKEQEVRNFERKRDVTCGPGIHFYLGAAGALKHLGLKDPEGVKIAERYARDALHRLQAGPL